MCCLPKTDDENARKAVKGDVTRSTDYIHNAMPGPAVGSIVMSVSRACLPSSGAPAAGQFRQKKRHLQPRSTAGKPFPWVKGPRQRLGYIEGRNGRIDVLSLAVYSEGQGLHNCGRLAIMLLALNFQCS